MIQTPKPDLTDNEEEATPFDDVLRQLLDAKPAPKQAPAPTPKPPRRLTPAHIKILWREVYDRLLKTSNAITREYSRA